ncbi:MAG: hypothetical protein JRJ41_07200, partial [Deltaproteobacteria bacterium]|nr:hypothetical protein [Deltaproteobacteria bacterium]
MAWTKMIPASEGQDPLGLQLRVTARLGADLLHCITSITPRSRYYSLLPWIIQYAQDHFPGQKLREAVRKIEKAFTTGCLLHHDGKACTGGGLVGSDVLKPWFDDGHLPETWRSAPFAVNPALDAYYTSLVNFHLFVGQKQESLDNEIEETTDWDGVYELSEIGQQLVSNYRNAIEGAENLIDLEYSAEPRLDGLKLWGEQGGLCELRWEAPDRQPLEDLFFNRVELPENAHMHRRDSLLLFLYLTNIFTNHGLQMNAVTLCTAAYYNAIRNLNGEIFSIHIPDALKDIAYRWRMFYHHRYLSYALEYLFSNTVNEANRDCLNGISIEQWMSEWSSPLVTARLNDLLGIDINADLLATAPRELLKATGVDIKTADREGGTALDRLLGLEHDLSEHALYVLLQHKSMPYTPESCILSTLMCVLTVMRYQRWHARDYGNWLAQATRNIPYENVTVPVVSETWKARFGDFWNTPLLELA